jgi:3-dehydrotetronate 4-kinase
MLLGCIADDLTGATDLALMLTRAGMRTLQVMEVPTAATPLDGFDAVVVALKSRTIPATDAVAVSLATAEALLARGAKQILFKYCSTFDSTDDGNIGPVSDALLERLGETLTLACPAFPANKRTIYLGNLYAGDVLLSESSMKDHPLTPMRDSNLVRVLQRQSKHTVGLVPFTIVQQGVDAIRAAFERARAVGQRHVIVDAITDQHLVDIGTAAADMKLITGGSGIALGLPANFVRQGLLNPVAASSTFAAPRGRAIILAGSCSAATRGQVTAAITSGVPAFRIDPLALSKGDVSVASLTAWALAQSADKPALIYSSATPDDVMATQGALGRDVAGHLIEATLAAVARDLVANGVTRLIVAGGETSGAVVNSLGITALAIGPEIDPGVPWTRTVGTRTVGTRTVGGGTSEAGPDLVLALKSGNFGTEDFFIKAWALLG